MNDKLTWSRTWHATHSVSYGFLDFVASSPQRGGSNNNARRPRHFKISRPHDLIKLIVLKGPHE